MFFNFFKFRKRKCLISLSEIRDILKILSQKRLVFHSEADFQHALAWEIHKYKSEFAIRLERRFHINGDDLYVDIFVFNGHKCIAIELKYKTKKLALNIKGEEFLLKEQSAQDTGRYDFCKDIERLEKMRENIPNFCGYAIFLTNDSAY